jgi:UDP-glucuronate 4-epimerase
MEDCKMKILVTGAAGFIGMNLIQRLISEGHVVIGVDNINSYYEQDLKYSRLELLGVLRDNITNNTKVISNSFFSFIQLDITDSDALNKLFEQEKFDVVINLAAQAGVRYSITNPKAYIDSNITGFYNILESCRAFPVKHLLYASSSSVYGNSVEIPFTTEQKTDEPISLYAATKKSNELMAFTYSHLFNLPITGLRFFTVYGPWGRPDMAYFSFTKNIINGDAISLFNNGDLYRDFTYIDDVVESIHRLITLPPKSTSRLLNIGNQNPVNVKLFVGIIEELVGRKAIIKSLPMQPGDVSITYANTNEVEELTGFKPNTKLEVGLAKFVGWFRSYYSVN